MGSTLAVRCDAPDRKGAHWKERMCRVCDGKSVRQMDKTEERVRLAPRLAPRLARTSNGLPPIGGVCLTRPRKVARSDPSHCRSSSSSTNGASSSAASLLSSCMEKDG